MEFPFEGDEWEFLHSLNFTKFNKKINVLEVGCGNISLLYALATAFETKMKNLYSLDVAKSSQDNNAVYQQKRSVISVIQNRGCVGATAVEEELDNPELIKDIEQWLGEDEKIDLLIFEFIKDEKTSNELFQKFNHLFDENMVIYYHNLKKAENSEKLFNNLAKHRKSVKLVYDQGVGIILD
jgi:hypothetical protein